MTYLVFNCPTVYTRCVHVQCGERILSADNESDEGEFGEAEDIGETRAHGGRGEIVTFYVQVRILVLDGLSKLLKHSPVPS